MLKIKKNLLALVVLSLSLYSCSSSTDEPAPMAPEVSIIGNWQYTQDGSIANNVEVLTNYVHASGCAKDYGQFLANNVFKDVYYQNPNCNMTVDPGTWSKTNNTLVVTIPNQSTTVTATILTLTSTTLKFKYVQGQSTLLAVLTRIP